MRGLYRLCFTNMLQYQGLPKREVRRGEIEEGNKELKGLMTVLRQNGRWIPCWGEYGVHNAHDQSHTLFSCSRY